MSSLISDLMQRRNQSESTDRSPSHEFDSKPNFNPLAGARDDAPPSRLRGWLTGSAYLVLSGVIVWQGWQLWQSPAGDSQPVQAAQQTLQTVPSDLGSDGREAESTTSMDQGTADQLTVVQANLQSAETPLLVDDTDTPPTPPEDVAMGTSDLPPLTPPSPVESSSTESARSDSQPDETPSTEATVAEASPPDTETQASAESVAPATTSDSPADSATESIAEDDPIPETARIDSADQGAAGSATFSTTRRNRELREAQALYQDGQTDQALAQLGSWLRRDDHTDVRQYYARLLLRADRAEEARYVLRPGYNLRELELRAYADFRSDAFPDALRHYSELLRRADNPQPEWYLWTAICHDNLNQSSRAIAMFERYLSQASGQPDSLVRHARDRVDALSG